MLDSERVSTLAAAADQEALLIVDQELELLQVGQRRVHPTAAHFIPSFTLRKQSDQKRTRNGKILGEILEIYDRTRRFSGENAPGARALVRI